MRHSFSFISSHSRFLLFLLVSLSSGAPLAAEAVGAPAATAPAVSVECVEADDGAPVASPCSKARAFAVATCAAALLTIVVPDPVAGVDELFLARACFQATRAARRICGE